MVGGSSFFFFIYLVLEMPYTVFLIIYFILFALLYRLGLDILAYVESPFMYIFCVYILFIIPFNLLSQLERF